MSDKLKAVETMSNDFIVHLYERYGQTKEEFANSILKKAPYAKILTGNGYQYEERSEGLVMPNVEFEKLFVGARLYKDDFRGFMAPPEYEEIEITHIHGNIAHFKWITGKHVEEEGYFVKDTIEVYMMVYPKVIYKPKGMNLSCYCEKTLILDED